MTELNFQQQEQINGGDGIDGFCGGLLLGEGAIGVAAIAVSYGWIGFIPGLNVAALVVGAAAAITCGIATIDN
jgi:hypothetical protein